VSLSQMTEQEGKSRNLRAKNAPEDPRADREGEGQSKEKERAKNIKTCGSSCKRLASKTTKSEGCTSEMKKKSKKTPSQSPISEATDYLGYKKTAPPKTGEKGEIRNCYRGREKENSIRKTLRGGTITKKKKGKVTICPLKLAQRIGSNEKKKETQL